MIYRLIAFLLLNFGALGIGGLFTSQGVPSDWYAGLEKAPWTPPGWFFGFAWTTIMICYAIYMAKGWGSLPNRRFFLVLFGFQWILNIAWNPTFFYFHQVGLGLVVISCLTILIAYFFFYYRKLLGSTSLFILPYLLWLIVATSLNFYILLMN